MLKKLRQIGPGAMIAAAFIGPGTVTTATIAGAGHGFTLLWAVVFSTGATYLLQEMAARLGIIGRMGVGEAIRAKVQHPLGKVCTTILVISAIFIGNAAYEAGNISGAVLGFDLEVSLFGNIVNPLVFLIGGLAFLLLWNGQSKVIERALVLLVSLMGMVFIVAAVAIKPPLSEILQGMFLPTLPENALLFVIGLIGTTVVPYNLFLHASSVKSRWTNESDLSHSRWDTSISVVGGGLITMAILITAAVAFAETDRSIGSATDLAIQLQPILGNWAKSFIAIGFLAAGLSSAITAPLAAAYASSEILGWQVNLQAKKFRMIWIAVLLIGLVFSSLGFKPTLVILFAQVSNGLLLPVVAGFLVWIMNDKSIMGRYTNSLWVNVLGGLVILVALLLGGKGILTAFQLI
ncbi:MAG: Nramp family divalent metal transporter [Bacteroidota bacterium]